MAKWPFFGHSCTRVRKPGNSFEGRSARGCACRSDFKIEQNFFAVDIATPLSVLQQMTDAALQVRCGAAD